MSSAFDRVDRKVLLNIIRDNNILNKDQIKILKFILKNIRIKYGNHNANTTNGVPQGGTSSPELFKIAIKGLVDILVANQSITHRLYADDIILIGQM